MDKGQLIQLLQEGQIAVIPTDTIYGIVGSAFDPLTVEEIYRLRKRSPEKPMIILISSTDDLERFEIQLTDKQKDFLTKIWPNPISVILSCDNQEFEYLHRGKKALAFRIPKEEFLLGLIEKTGPLVAPSANFEGEKAAESIEEAKKYFADQVVYIDGGDLKSRPSTLIELTKEGFKILREGTITAEEIKRLLEQ